MTALRFLPPAAKYLKKLKDKHLKQLYQSAINKILDDPFIGEEKKGDLRGVRGYDIFYNRTNYELAYTVESYIDEKSGEEITVVVIMAGTRENFYEQLKQYWK